MMTTTCIKHIGIISSLVYLSISAVAKESQTTQQPEKSDDFTNAIAHIKNLPPPPDGFQWAVRPDLTDEFNGDDLDESKWYRHSPFWSNGRPPATFKPENVTVSDGFLKIKDTLLPKPEGYNGKEGDLYKYAGGAVASKATDALFGYYETRMKASDTTMSSTFWLMGIPQKFEFVTPDGKKHIEFHCTELDIVETVGKSTKYSGWDKTMNSNAHYRVSPKEGKEKFYSKGCQSPAFKDFTCDDFHTYGCWWIDANTIKFYCDGKLIGTVNPRTDKNHQPFSLPMYIHFVTETYNFQGVPSSESLQDESKNKTYYDWVRVYRLVPTAQKDSNKE